MEECGGLVQPILTVCLDEIVGFVASAGMEENRSENLTTLLNTFLKYADEVLAELVNERALVQGCVP